MPKLPYFYPTVALSSCDNGGPDRFGENSAFEFPVPPGTYRLRVNAQDVYTHYELVTIPPGDGDFVLPPVKVHVSEGLSIAGHPAPPLNGVVAWKNGGPVDLAALKGKVVLVNFWGYWCGGCVNEMPTPSTLQRTDSMQDRGLMIVTGVRRSTPMAKSIPWPKLDERERRAIAKVSGVAATCRFRRHWPRGRSLERTVALRGQVRVSACWPFIRPDREPIPAATATSSANSSETPRRAKG